MPADKTIKAVAYQTDKDELVLAFIRGDHDVNEVKVINQIEGALDLRMADEEAIRAAGGCPGFMGPIGIKRGTHVLVDATVMNMHNAVTGANEADFHLKNVNPQRDFAKDAIIVTDLRMVKEGDPCPHCGAPLKMTRGIEPARSSRSARSTARPWVRRSSMRTVKSSRSSWAATASALAARWLPPSSRTMTTRHRLATRHRAVRGRRRRRQRQEGRAADICRGIYDECRKAGLDVLLDDRKERAGVKFKDCDLIGYPVRVTIGPKAVDDDIIEVKVRKTGEVYNFTRADYLEKVEELLKDSEPEKMQ